MSKHLVVILLLLSVSLQTSAYSHKKVKHKVKVKSASTKTAGLTTILMRRGACMGRCPQYVIVIHRDGMVEYRGIRNVPITGVYERNLGAAKVAALFGEFEEDRADTCQSYYKPIIPDVPTLYYELTLNGKMKPIGNAHFGPAFLKSLSHEVDNVAGTPDASWRKTSDSAGE